MGLAARSAARPIISLLSPPFPEGKGDGGIGRAKPPRLQVVLPYITPLTSSRSYSSPTAIAPIQKVPTTRAITRQRAMLNAPPMAPMEVPAPEIKKASAAPWLMPESSMARTIGREASLLR